LPGNYWFYIGFIYRFYIFYGGCLCASIVRPSPTKETNLIVYMESRFAAAGKHIIAPATPAGDATPARVYPRIRPRAERGC
jgi:hypothetical protein